MAHTMIGRTTHPSGNLGKIISKVSESTATMGGATQSWARKHWLGIKAPHLFFKERTARGKARACSSDPSSRPQNNMTDCRCRACARC